MSKRRTARKTGYDRSVMDEDGLCVWRVGLHTFVYAEGGCGSNLAIRVESQDVPLVHVPSLRDAGLYAEAFALGFAYGRD